MVEFEREIFDLRRVVGDTVGAVDQQPRICQVSLVVPDARARRRRVELSIVTRRVATLQSVGDTRNGVERRRFQRADSLKLVPQTEHASVISESR